MLVSCWDHIKVTTKIIIKCTQKKFALSSDDDNRLQTFNRITTYPYGRPAVKVWENEMMVVKKIFVKKNVDCPFYGEIVLRQ